MLGSAPLMALAATAKPDEAKAFYQHKLGMKLISDDRLGLVFQGKNATLRVSKVQSFTPQPFTVLGWVVDDIAKTAAELAAKGVALTRHSVLEQDAAGVWTAPDGSKVAWFADPDGNVLSLAQFV